MFAGPSPFDDLTLSLMDSKKQRDNDGLAITVITRIFFLLYIGASWGAMYAIRDLVGPSQIFNLLAVLMPQLIS